MEPQTLLESCTTGPTRRSAQQTSRAFNRLWPNNPDLERSHSSHYHSHLVKPQ